MLYENIRHLVDYGIRTGLTPECERIYTTNLLLDLFHEDNYEEPEAVAYGSPDLETILANLLNIAVERGIIEDNVCLPRYLRHKAYELSASKTRTGTGSFLGKICYFPRKSNGLLL